MGSRAKRWLLFSLLAGLCAVQWGAVAPVPTSSPAPLDTGALRDDEDRLHRAHPRAPVPCPFGEAHRGRVADTSADPEAEGQAAAALDPRKTLPLLRGTWPRTCDQTQRRPAATPRHHLIRGPPRRV